MRLKGLVTILGAGLIAGSVLLILKGGSAVTLDSQRNSAVSEGDLVKPKVQLKNSIWPGGEVRLLAYSPDGRYLGIAVAARDGHCLIIWDLQDNKPKVRIPCATFSLVSPWDVQILWSPDGKYITFGANARLDPDIYFWDPQDGRLVEKLRVHALLSRYNRDGSKLLVNCGGLPRKYRVYDTKTWSYWESDGDGIAIDSVCWTGDDKLLIVGGWSVFNDGLPIPGFTLDGVSPRPTDEMVVRLVDPSQREPSRTVIVRSATPDPRYPGENGKSNLYESKLAIPDFAHNRVAMGVLQMRVIDVATLKPLYVYDYKSIPGTELAPAMDGKAFSADGKYLFLLGGVNVHNPDLKSWVIDANTGNPLTPFVGGVAGLAANPKRSEIAVGCGDHIEMFDVN